jgi:hypothetical protein
MDFKLKIVTATPIRKLWTETGFMEIVRGKNINSEDVKAGLPTTQFVIADVGIKLKWIDEID